MSDAEIVAGFMEPKPPSAPEYWMASGTLSTYDGWWMVAHLDAGVNEWLPNHGNTKSLDALREVEAKLSDEQWRDYTCKLITLGGFSGWENVSYIKPSRLTATVELPQMKQLAHASADQKLKALAAVLSNEVKS